CGAGGNHPPRTDRRRHDPSFLRSPARTSAGRISASVSRADSQAHARCAALSGATAAHGHGRREFHGRRSRRVASRDGLQAIDGNHSGWKCRWENGGVRLGLRFVKGLREVTGKKIEENQTFRSAEDLAYRCKLRDDQLTKLAYAGALGSLGLTRRGALWQASK